jgi:hypothetical protein
LAGKTQMIAEAKASIQANVKGTVVGFDLAISA